MTFVSIRSTVLLPADELASLMETVYLLRSPSNARRLAAAYVRSQDGEGSPQAVEDLKRELGLVAPKE